MKDLFIILLSADPGLRPCRGSRHQEYGVSGEIFHFQRRFFHLAHKPVGLDVGRMLQLNELKESLVCPTPNLLYLRDVLNLAPNRESRPRIQAVQRFAR